MPDLALVAIHELAMNGGRLSDDTARQLGEALADETDNGPDIGDVEAPPDGSANVVLDWVDEDPDRARLALEAENERDRPRKALSASLAEIIEDDQEV